MVEVTPESVKPMLEESVVMSSGSVQFITPSGPGSEWYPFSTGSDLDGGGGGGPRQRGALEVERARRRTRSSSWAALLDVAR